MAFCDLLSVEVPGRFHHWYFIKEEIPMFSNQRTARSCDSYTDRPHLFRRLLDDARRGESEALSALYREFFPTVFAYIRLRVPDGMAEDVTSEVFLQMVESIHQLRTSDETGFIGWLLQIARITIANYYRQRRKQPMYVHFELTLLRKEDTSEIWMIPASHPDTDPVRWTEAREEWDRVIKAINMLTEEQRQVLIGRLLLGYHVKTVARTIGKNANAVKALQFRALRSLKRLLSQGWKPV